MRDISFSGWALVEEGGTYYLSVAAGTESSAEFEAVNDAERFEFTAALQGA